MKTWLKILKAGGLLAAPWFYLTGRLLRSPSLGKLALSLDPQYLRALQGSSLQSHSVMQIGRLQVAALLTAEASYDASERILRLLGITESQLLQDIFCLIVLEEKRSGFFVEVGVGNGQLISNTYILEKYYGWKGLLVEPNRSSHDNIAACRSATLERRAAASKSGQKLLFQEIVDAGEHSRIVGTGGHAISGATTKQYDVETVALTEILDGLHAPTDIDFLSLDTEGSEIDILRGLDLTRYSFKVMVIEHNYDKSTQDKLDSILVPLGYRLVFPHISGFDAWYVHKDVKTSGFHLLQNVN